MNTLDGNGDFVMRTLAELPVREVFPAEYIYDAVLPASKEEAADRAMQNKGCDPFLRITLPKKSMQTELEEFDVDGDGIAMWAGSTPYHDFPFALTIPADAADGDYDMCVLAYNTISGLQTAKPFRVTLPEAGWEYWTNNRPKYYDPTPANDCSAYVG